MNETYLKEKYKIFEGHYLSQIQKILLEGRKPGLVSTILRARLETKDSPPGIKKFFWNLELDSVDCIASHPKGKFKIIYDCQILKEYISTPEKWEYEIIGRLILENSQYEKLEGPEFTKKDWEKYSGKEFDKSESKTNPILRALVNDNKLLENYVELYFDNKNIIFTYICPEKKWVESKEEFLIKESRGISLDLDFLFHKRIDIPLLGYLSINPLQITGFNIRKGLQYRYSNLIGIFPDYIKN